MRNILDGNKTENNGLNESNSFNIQDFITLYKKNKIDETDKSFSKNSQLFH